ncbi:MAG: TonB family protein [Burkholderiaceae bacterium]|nr:TonB family protein [Burkholderiaceae bacterium]
MPTVQGMQKNSSSDHQTRRSPFALLFVVLSHVVLLIAFLSVRNHTTTVITPPLFVSLLPSAANTVQPEITPPQTKLISQAPTQPQIAPPAVLYASENNTPTPLNASALTSSTPQAVANQVATVAPALAAATPVTPSAASTPSAPKFDADYLNNPAPKYPPISRRAGEEGKVLLRVFVDANGAPTQVEINNTSGFERLDKAAITAVSHWKFIAAQQAGQAVGAWVLVPIIFSLKV